VARHYKEDANLLQVKKTKPKAGRRGNNEGSIFQRKDGRWSGIVTTGYKTDGKPIRKTIYGKTRNEVAVAVAEMTSTIFTNGYTAVSARNDTVCKRYVKSGLTFLLPSDLQA